MDSPRYEHDCSNCVYLGRWKEFDLYHCPKIEERDENYIARYGDEGSYLSGYRIAIEQHEAGLKGGRLGPLGMAVTYLKTDHNKKFSYTT